MPAIVRAIWSRPISLKGTPNNPPLCRLLRPAWIIFFGVVGTLLIQVVVLAQFGGDLVRHHLTTVHLR